EEARVRPEVDHGQARLVEIADDRLHVAEDGRVARQVGDEPVGELHYETDRWAVTELGTVGFQQVLLGLREQRRRYVVAVRGINDREFHALLSTFGPGGENAAQVDPRAARCRNRDVDRQSGAEVHRLAAAATNRVHLVVNEASHRAGRHQDGILRRD